MQKLIFIVDDNDANLTLAATALEKQYRVLTMPSAEKMFSLLEKNKKPELIILDVEMPGMNGIDALSKLRENPAWKTLPVVFFTGHCEKDLFDKSNALGAAGVILKPIVRDRFLEQVTRILEP